MPSINNVPVFYGEGVKKGTINEVYFKLRPFETNLNFVQSVMPWQHLLKNAHDW